MQPGKPTQNTFIEHLNRTCRQSILDKYLLENLNEVRNEAAIWMRDYNYERPHKVIGNIAPKQYADITKFNKSLF
ncbi:MAG: hypothetical protein COB98_10135 [Flavobacteriaceae bacterium]|nr:MAG: hypothetical protein COB98_10135 [Flavobacteriaceae bacterium]